MELQRFGTTIDVHDWVLLKIELQGWISAKYFVEIWIAHLDFELLGWPMLDVSKCTFEKCLADGTSEEEALCVKQLVYICTNCCSAIISVVSSNVQSNYS